MQNLKHIGEAQPKTVLDQAAQAEAFLDLRDHGYEIRGDVGHASQVIRARDGSVDVIATARLARSIKPVNQPPARPVHRTFRVD